MKNKLIVVTSLLLIALSTVGCSQAKSDQLEKSFTVKPGGTLYLDSDSGSIEIESHSRNSVEIEIRRKGRDADNFDVEISQDGNDIKIKGERERGLFSFSGGIHFDIKVPKNYNLELETGGGSIELSDLEGEIHARTSGGSIDLGEIIGDVDVKTSGGSIKVEDVTGNLEAHTSGGSIKAKISKQLTQDSRLTTSGGSIRAFLLPSVAIDLYASTSGGRVRSEFDVDGTVKKTKIKGKINGGGPELVLKTSGGSVSIEKI